MNKGLQWKLLGIIALTIVCIMMILPPFTVKDSDGKVLQKGKINLGLDLQGGMHVVLRVDMSKVPLEARKDAVERVMEIVRNRIDQFGVGEMAIQRQGKENIIVQLPGISDRERALEIIGKTAHLEFKIVSDNAEDIKNILNKMKNEITRSAVRWFITFLSIKDIVPGNMYARKTNQLPCVKILSFPHLFLVFSKVGTFNFSIFE